MTNRLLHQLVDESTQKFPNSSALCMLDRTLTYDQLYCFSNTCANHLITLGFQPQNPVGIYCHKSLEAVIGLFGVLKAGGFYIPLDCEYSPLPRIKQIISQSHCKFFLSTYNLWQNLLESVSNDQVALLHDCQVILLDTMLSDTPMPIYGDISTKMKDLCQSHWFDRSVSTKPPRHNSRSTQDDIAYVLYTSGSSGIPKGVMLSHGNALSFIQWAQSYFSPNTQDVFSSIAPLHFDLSIFDMFVSLACGASVHLLPQQSMNNPRALVPWISHTKITFFYSVPSVWVSILKYTDFSQNDVPHLKHILFAGEVFSPNYLTALMQRLPHVSFYNLYGPTETNVCTFNKVQHHTDIKQAATIIGKPCTEAEAVVLKTDDEIAHIGEEGELLIRGPMVFKGYYHDSGKTLSAFKKIPSSLNSEVPFYKTGDRVQRIDSETLKYVGRIDLMVKYNGFRIELPEIELALLNYAMIAEAAVVAVNQDTELNNSYLVAFVTLQNNNELHSITLKQFLACIVPKYMIPDIIHVLVSMPKNANGKVDRQALKNLAQQLLPKMNQ